jgi:hypothetical protein
LGCSRRVSDLGASQLILSAISAHRLPRRRICACKPEARAVSTQALFRNARTVAAATREALQSETRVVRNSKSLIHTCLPRMSRGLKKRAPRARGLLATRALQQHRERPGSRPGSRPLGLRRDSNRGRDRKRLLFNAEDRGKRIDSKKEKDK